MTDEMTKPNEFPLVYYDGLESLDVNLVSLLHKNESLHSQPGGIIHQGAEQTINDDILKMLCGVDTFPTLDCVCGAMHEVPNS